MSDDIRPKVVLAIKPGLIPLLMPKQTLDGLGEFADVEQIGQEAEMAEESLSRALREADGVITSWGTPTITSEMARQAPRLRIIAHAAGSVRTIVQREVLERGVVVTQTAYEIGYAVAEFSLALILGGLRLTWLADRRLQQTRRWRDAGPPIEQCWDLRGRTVGVVALSLVGQQVVPLLKRFDCRVLAYDPYAPAEVVRRLGVEIVTLEYLFEQSEVVTIHLPLIDRTRGMITAGLLSRLPDGALIVNTSRGAVIDERALAVELQSGRLRAALDVTDPEPPTAESPLYGLENVLVTPHVAGGTIHARRAQGRRAVEDLRLFFSGQPLPRRISLEAWDRLA